MSTEPNPYQSPEVEGEAVSGGVNEMSAMSAILSFCIYFWVMLRGEAWSLEFVVVAVCGVIFTAGYCAEAKLSPLLSTAYATMFFAFGVVLGFSGFHLAELWHC